MSNIFRMKNRVLAALIALTITAPLHAAPEFVPVAGRDYTVLDARTQKAGRLPSPVVTEYFNYGCPFCAAFRANDAAMQKALPADTSMEYVPIVLHAGWDAYARAYYAAAKMNLLTKTHWNLYAEIYDRHTSFTSLADLAARFYVPYGVTASALNATATSQQVTALMAEDASRAIAAGVDSTPTIIINNHYRLSPAILDNKDQLTSTVTYLLRVNP